MPYRTRTMTHEETESFLNETHMADLATLKRDGSPHVAPQWYHYDGKDLYFIAGKTSIKVRNIERDPRVMVSIAAPGFPLRYVLIEGTAEVADADREKTTRAIHTRYRGAEAAEQTVRDSMSSYDLAVITVHPTKKITWVREDV